MPSSPNNSHTDTQMLFSPGQLEVAREQIQAIDLTSKMELAALSILIWDYLLTFNLEFNLIWSAKFNGGTFLFFLTRYLPIADILVGLIGVDHQDSGNSRKACPRSYTAIVWLDVAGIQIAELILVLRTWAVYGRNKWILMGLLAVQTGSLVYFCVADQQYVQSIVWSGPEFAGISGCLILSADNWRNQILGNYIGIVALETIILVLTCARTFNFGGDRNKAISGLCLSHVILRDGLIFYFFILGISVANLVVLFMAPVSYFAILIVFQRTMHSIATGRIILHLRQVALHSAVHIQEFGSSLQAHEVWKLETCEGSLPVSSSHLISQSDFLHQSQTDTSVSVEGRYQME
ncbi:hypothetical protein DL96DRAFT_1775631 [Flagelloscypha sp. PMI_526]|nr:hypothetical protein DL96DRAFT_1775631 [Flagelloscypha sp. PMI_526]